MRSVRKAGMALLLTLTAAVALRSSAPIAAASGSDSFTPPARLIDTGLYEDGRLGVMAPTVRPFSPQYPLWSDGAIKARWIYLPPGTAIDASQDDAWDFPVGTRFWKEFAFNGRKVETRFSWRASPSRWVFATYVWNDDGTDAVLAPADGVPGAVEIAAGRRHDIPSANACTACHGAEQPRPLGFSALQLSDDRDPNAIHGEPLTPDMVTLRSLARDGLLSPAPADLDKTAPRIRTASATTRAALGYLLANCGSCHNGRDEIAVRAPVFRDTDLMTDGDAVARALVDRATYWQAPGTPEGGSVLVNSHMPEASAILLRMRSRRPSSQMPPLGTVIRDDDAVQAIARWIETDLVPRRVLANR